MATPSTDGRAPGYRRLNDAFGSAIDICWAIGTFALYFTGIVLRRYPDRIRLLYFDVLESDYEPEQLLQPDHHQYRRSRTYFEILDTESKISDADGVTKLPPVKGADHVFPYDGEF